MDRKKMMQDAGFKIIQKKSHILNHVSSQFRENLCVSVANKN